MKEVLKTLNNMLEKYLRKSSIFNKVAGSKKELIHTYFLRIFQIGFKYGNLFQYINKYEYHKFRPAGPSSLGPYTLHRINLSGIQNTSGNGQLDNFWKYNQLEKF